jgi:hypothetical protein
MEMPMSSEQVEVLIFGSVQGGMLLAWHMAQSGRRTTVVERHGCGADRDASVRCFQTPHCHRVPPEPHDVPPIGAGITAGDNKEDFHGPL